MNCYDLSALGELVWQYLQPQDRRLLSDIGLLAREQGATAALVGGAVRDALLGKTPLDLDVVLEGVHVQQLAQQLTQLPSAQQQSAQHRALDCTIHSKYDNVALKLADGRTLDLVRARRETYPHAGAAPHVEPASLLEDLARRDFSLNAVALLLSERRLFDPLHGLPDVKTKVLRPLSTHSFWDDASRLIRGARLAGRLDLSVTEEFHEQVPSALQVAEQTPRLWAELALLLHETAPLAALRKLHSWGAGSLMPEPEHWPALAELSSSCACESSKSVRVDWVMYGAALLHENPAADFWKQRLRLGERPTALLLRALSETAYAENSQEWQLRRILRPAAYRGLTGKDVLSLGVPRGKMVGQALDYLATLRRQNEVTNLAEEWAALKEWAVLKKWMASAKQSEE